MDSSDAKIEREIADDRVADGVDPGCRNFFLDKEFYPVGDDCVGRVIVVAAPHLRYLSTSRCYERTVSRLTGPILFFPFSDTQGYIRWEP